MTTRTRNSHQSGHEKEAVKGFWQTDWKAEDVTCKMSFLIARTVGETLVGLSAREIRETSRTGLYKGLEVPLSKCPLLEVVQLNCDMAV